MNEEKDILHSPEARENPFRMPEGYLDSFEDRLMARIAAEEKPAVSRTVRFWTVLKPVLTLAAMFALIFGMGYGVLSLTRTLGNKPGTDAPASYATAEEEMIRPASLINYYQTGPAEEPELDEDAILDYLASELSFSELAEIYAQAY
jgi:hypothetical protein